MESEAQSAKLRRQLVRALQRRGRIRTSRVRDAFLSVPREVFVEEFADREGLVAVYRDEPILTKRNRHGVPLSSSSQPAIMAPMLEQLGIEEGMNVLEIGAGTGYNAALLSLLVGRRGHVVSVDVDPERARAASRALRAAGYKARVVVGDGREGWADAAPYDRIIVTASSDAVPAAWFEQLGSDGLLEVPLRLSRDGAQAIPVLEKRDRGFRSITVIAGGFMPLRAPGDEAAAELKRSTLLATDSTGDSDIQIQALAGESLRTLSASAKRRLLSISLAEPRRRPLGVRANSGALTLFLSLALPDRNLVTTAPRFGIGAITRDGRSLAVLEPVFERTSSTVSSFCAYGAEAAEHLLRRSVRDWSRRGGPAVSDVTITVRYSSNGKSSVRCRWPSPTR